MKYHILFDFGTSSPFKEKSSHDFQDFHKLKLLTNFDVNVTSFPGGVMNNLGDLGENSLRQRCGQSISLLRRLKQEPLPQKS